MLSAPTGKDNSQHEASNRKSPERRSIRKHNHREELQSYGISIRTATSFRWLVAVTFQPGNPGQVDAEKESFFYKYLLFLLNTSCQS